MNAYAHFYKYVETLDDLKYDLIKHMKDLVYRGFFPLGLPLKVLSTEKLIKAMLGVSRTIYRFTST